MSEQRIVIVPPASPGSKGDEAMILGALELFDEFEVLIASPDGTQGWIEYLGLNRRRKITETRPMLAAIEELRDNDILFFLGADVIDGTCGVGPAVERFELMEAAVVRRLRVFAVCSFRSSVDPSIIEDITLLAGCVFLLRDSDSLRNFNLQTSLQGLSFPDTSFFAKETPSKAADLLSEELSHLRRTSNILIGLNFAEHSFRSFSDIHDENQRSQFVSDVLTELNSQFPEAGYLLFSNDIRRFPNHISDDDFSALARSWITERLGEERCLRLPLATSYNDNIALLQEVDFLITGRMHLAYASFRARTPAIVVMGAGRGYSSVDKMRGAFRTHIGNDRWIVTSLARLGIIAADLVTSLSQVRQQLSEFKQQIECECSIAKDALHSMIKSDRGTAADQRAVRLATFRNKSRLIAARNEILVQDLSEGKLKIEQLESKIVLHEEKLIALSMQLEATELRLKETEAIATELAKKSDDLQSRLSAEEQRASTALQAADQLQNELIASKAMADEHSERALASLQSLASGGHIMAYELGRYQQHAKGSRRESPEALWTQFVSETAHGVGGFIPAARVEDWGERETTLGVPVNEQPDGSSAIWIRINGLQSSDGLSVQFGQHPARKAHRESESLVTSSIPDEVIQCLGSYPVTLIDLQKRHLHVGVFRVQPQRNWISKCKALFLGTRRVSGGSAVSEQLAEGLSKLSPQRLSEGSEIRARKSRILVADDRIPRPDASAGERATIGILNDLVSLGFEVVFVATDMHDNEGCRAHLDHSGVTVITRTFRLRRAVDYVEAFGSSFDAFYLIRVDVAEELLPSARRVAPHARIVFHAPDLYFLREFRAASLSGCAAELTAAHQTKSRESRMMRAADLVVVVSQIEKTWAQDAVPEAEIAVFPALYCSIATEPPDFDQRANIVFVGGFGHQPNVSAVRWFVEDVWPLIHEALPNVTFHIVGSEAPAEVVALGRRPGVVFVGYVKDLECAIQRFRLNVAPLLVGAGIKGKLGVAMGAGTPSVTTSIGAEGMEIVNGVHAFIGDDAARFVTAVLELYGNRILWQRIARAGLEHAQDMFGVGANQASLTRVLELARILPPDLYALYCMNRPSLALPRRCTSDTAAVSIVVSAHKKWEFNRAALNSVVAACSAISVSVDVRLSGLAVEHQETARREYPGVQIDQIGHERVSVESRASKEGDWVVFLRAGLVVMPMWLAAMLKTAQLNPAASIILSRLLSIDGAILEAGNVLFSDGSYMPVGLGASRANPLYMFDREVDCTSHSALMVRSSLLSSIGADLNLTTGHAEDWLRLALLARQAGQQIYYSAHSIAVETSTDCTRATTTRSFLGDPVASSMMMEHWGAALQEQQLLRGTDPLIAAAHAERHIPARALERRRSGHLNILYFSPFPSHPSNHGNQATIQSFGKRFQRMGHRVHFALLESSLYGDADREAMCQAWDSLDIIQHSCKLWSDGSEIPFDGWYDEALGEKIRILCETHQIDVVFCSYVFQSKLLEYVPAHVLKVIDTHDRMGDRYQMLRENGQPVEFFSCTPDEEGAYLRRADVVAARRLEEARYFDRVTGRQTAIVLPHVEDARFRNRDFGTLRKVGIVASANRINLIILHDFLAELGRRCGDVCPFDVEVAGQVKDMIPDLDREQQKVFSRPWLKMLGFVADIAEFYDRIDLVVSPVTMGTGINVKTVQAMAFGMPLLTTTVGIKGIESSEALHNNSGLSELVDSLLSIQSTPAALQRLSEVSRDRYTLFLTQANLSFTELLEHDKLKNIA